MYGSWHGNEHGLLSILFACVTSRTHFVHCATESNSLVASRFTKARGSQPLRLKGTRTLAKRDRLIAVSWH
jgi:hypothetical protein